MPVRVKVVNSLIEVEITNLEQSPSDGRKEGPHQDYLSRKDTLTLIRDLVTALERLEARAKQAN